MLASPARPGPHGACSTPPVDVGRIWRAYAHEGERNLPPRTRPHGEVVVWVRRGEEGQHLVDTVTSALTTGRADGLRMACAAAIVGQLDRAHRCAP
ncbi:hypothetical protein ACLQ2S_08205 [Micromonospora sp. DT48]|uniref:hypothetical protein n=1 Tax=unclassified Micromonospora TaxID=2617518 RepID=UPI0012BCBF40|nr:hypothetical protein [Micromonospora sp. CP22]MTK02420.1 hypothetical protein [Micromonospora sp. CP22]